MTILSMLFKGIPGDDQVYQSDFDGSGWSSKIAIPQIMSSSHPMWSRYYDQTILTAWRNVASPHSVQAARFDGPTAWVWLGAVPGATSDAPPAGAAMTASSDFLLVWKSSDHTIHYSIFDSLHWSAVSTVAGATSSHGPAVARFGGKMHLVWKGIPGDHNIYYATYNGAWSAPQQIPQVATTSQPALTTYGGRLVLVFRGKEGDVAIYWSFLDSVSGAWLPPVRISTFQTSTAPAILEFAGRLHMVWKGIGDDYSLYMANFDGAFWWPQHQIPEVASSSTPTLAEFDPSF